MKPRCQAHCPTPQIDMGMAWTRFRNVSRFCEYLDTFSEYVHGVDMFTTKLRSQFTASPKLEQTINANLRGLCYAG